MATYPELAGRTALVTGGADGIGRAIVELCAEQGMRVGLLDIDGAAAQALAARLGAAGSKCVARTVDLRDATATAAAIAALTERLGTVDLLVNNAGHDERHSFDAVTPAYWDDRFAVNLRHMMFAAQAVVPGMREKGGGVIVNIGSTSWMKGAPGIIAYTTAKSATIGFTRALARELGPFGIRVNCVTPGWVMTARQRALHATPQALARAQEVQSLKGEILPEDIAPMVVFLASAGGRMCTGQNFIVDAGVV